MKKSLLLLAVCCLWTACGKVSAPEPVGALPSEKQLNWHQLERYAFIHFGINVYTDREWGYGEESPALFNPTDLDATQWVSTIKNAGFNGLILTAKHHDGFCLWPSAYTDHSIKNSPWRDGKGDLVREVADACKTQNLKFGVYLSPWDRNHAKYGQAEYIEYYRNQLRELLTNYGDVFEVWFDGANGGDGWYGGADETRKIDNATYYDWENTWSIVRELQPDAVMFSDGGPDVRWVGNERGFAGETDWATVNGAVLYPGVDVERHILNEGVINGTDWIPAECDVSIRPGWFYHTQEDDQVKTVAELLDIYYGSVGRNASMLLNLTPDHRGLIPSIDSVRLQDFHTALQQEFTDNLVSQAKITASNIRGGAKQFAASKLTDGEQSTYWAADDATTRAELMVEFDQPTLFNRLLLQEYIPLGQRVKNFTVEVWSDGAWESIAQETTIGYKRILRFPTYETTKIRVNLTEALACPILSNLEIYNAPDPGPGSPIQTK